jgi:hypothetical protein
MRSLEGFSGVANQHSTRGVKAQETKMQAGKRAPSCNTRESGYPVIAAARESRIRREYWIIRFRG